MSEKDKTEPRAGTGDSDAQKKRLIQRLGVAAVLIAALLAGLALFERGELQEAGLPPAGVPKQTPSQFARGQVQPVTQVQPEQEAPVAAAAATTAAPAVEAATPPMVPPEPPSPDVAPAGRKATRSAGGTAAPLTHPAVAAARSSWL